MTPTLPADPWSIDLTGVQSPLLAYDPHVLFAMACIVIAGVVAAVLLTDG